LEPRPWHSAAHRACRNQSNIHPRLNTKQPEHALRDYALHSLSIRWRPLWVISMCSAKGHVCFTSSAIYLRQTVSDCPRKARKIPLRIPPLLEDWRNTTASNCLRYHADAGGRRAECRGRGERHASR
jgi:hypothetical protein